jgi:hypothetical protein
MTTYWMHIGPDDPKGWYVYKVDDKGRVFMLDQYPKRWDRTSLSSGYPLTATGYARVPDSAIVLMGLPL